MILEAVWFKDGKEIEWVDPVMNIMPNDEIQFLTESFILTSIKQGEYG